MLARIIGQIRHQPPKLVRNEYLGHPVHYREGEHHFIATVAIYGPFEVYSPPAPAEVNPYDFLTTRIYQAVEHMFDGEQNYSAPPSGKDLPVNQLKCDQCDALTDPARPAALWREVKPLYTLPGTHRPQPQHFCSDQCQVNFILQTGQPVVITSRTGKDKV